MSRFFFFWCFFGIVFLLFVLAVPCGFVSFKFY